MKYIRNLLLFFSIGALVAASAFGRVQTQHPGTSSTNSGIQSRDVDSINLFNGALTITLDAAGSYAIGSDFSLSFPVVLNSSIWDFQNVVCEPQGPYDLPIPDDKYNLGHGGQLLPLGLLVKHGPYWNYRSPDGSVHTMSERLHDNYPAEPDPLVDYSTSGTYLRVREFPLGSPKCEDAGACLLLDFPTGEVREYHPQTVKGQTVYLPTRATDVHGQWIKVTYPADGSRWSARR